MRLAPFYIRLEIRFDIGWLRNIYVNVKCTKRIVIHRETHTKRDRESVIMSAECFWFLVLRFKVKWRDALQRIWEMCKTQSKWNEFIQISYSTTVDLFARFRRCRIFCYYVNLYYVGGKRQLLFATTNANVSFFFTITLKWTPFTYLQYFQIFLRICMYATNFIKNMNIKKGEKKTLKLKCSTCATVKKTTTIWLVFFRLLLCWRKLNEHQINFQDLFSWPLWFNRKKSNSVYQKVYCFCFGNRNKKNKKEDPPTFALQNTLSIHRHRDTYASTSIFFFSRHIILHKKWA